MSDKIRRVSVFVEIVVLLKEIRNILKDSAVQDRLAYSVPQFAERVGLSDQQIYNHIAVGDLTPKYSGTKRLIPLEEAHRFVAELPDEDRGRL